MISRTKAHKEGYKAAMAGKPRHNNPYDLNSSLHVAWYQGYDGACEKYWGRNHPAKIYVAVVCKVWERSGRPAGDWACFINKQKSEAIRAAIAARKKWSEKGYGPYRILVGVLGEEVSEPPVRFELKTIEFVSDIFGQDFGNMEDVL